MYNEEAFEKARNRVKELQASSLPDKEKDELVFEQLKAMHLSLGKSSEMKVVKCSGRSIQSDFNLRDYNDCLTKK